MITIKLEGPKEGNPLSSLPNELKNNLLQGMQKGIDLIIATSTKKYLSGPYPMNLTDSGRRLGLKKGLYGWAKFSNVPGEFIRAEVGENVRLGTVHEQTGERISSFVITSKTKGYLHFFWKRKGIWLRKKFVNIPARPFLRPAIIDNIENIKMLLDTMIKKAAKQSVGGP